MLNIANTTALSQVSKDKSPKNAGTTDSLRNSNNFEMKKKNFFNPTNDVIMPPSSKKGNSKGFMSIRNNGNNSPTGSSTNLPNSYISKYGNN